MRVGFVPGPYADEFRQRVEPQLVRNGYSVSYVQFSTGLEANRAVYRGAIVADVMQRSIYLKCYNDRNGTDLVGVVQVPTPPIGLFSNKHRALSEVKKGATVAVPNDPVNLERALKILQRIGWIRVRPNPNPVDVTERDVIDNPAGAAGIGAGAARARRCRFRGDSGQLRRVQRTRAVERACARRDEFFLRESGGGEGRESAFDADEDIVAAYRSDAFRQAITGNHAYDGFRLPDYFPH